MPMQKKFEADTGTMNEQHAHRASARQTTRLASGLVSVLIFAACGCSDGMPSPADASTLDARPLCWSGGGTPSPNVEVELGVANEDFEPLLSERALTLHRGPQGGSHFFVQVRMKGLDPGARDLPGEAKPITRFEAYLENGEEITLSPCTYPFAFTKENPDGTYELSYPSILPILNSYIPDVYGQRVRITVEVIDSEGRYAADEGWVIATPAEQPADAAPADAIPADAGVPDALAAGAMLSP